MTFHNLKAATARTWLAAALFLMPATALGTSYATRVIEFVPAPGQFMNLDITTDNSGVLGAPATGTGDDPATDGIVSLGAFGGYVVLGFDSPVKNDPRNPYGVDFTVFGNAIGDGGADSSCEPGAVQVMKDLNGNGIPDDGPWLELAGSDYWLSTTVRGENVIYSNPLYNNAHAVPWRTSGGVTGAVLTSSAHTQQYYPDPFLFSGTGISGYELKGNRIAGAVNATNPRGVSTYHAPAFGYADTHAVPGGFDGSRPHNPYYADDNGAVTDGFDISWAVDADGNHVELDEIDFVKIYTAGLYNMGWLGEWSTEIDAVAVTEPDDSYIPSDYYLHYLGYDRGMVALGSEAQFEGMLFRNGRPCDEGTPHYSVDDPSVGTISADGLFTPLKEGSTVVRFSRRDGVTEAQAKIDVVSLTGVVAGTDDKASSVAKLDCIVGETLYVNVESTCNYEQLFPGSKGNRYCHDTYKWYNSNPETGTVDEYGTFTALKQGSTVLTACSVINPDLYAEIKVTVGKIPAVTLNKASMTIETQEPAGNWRAQTLFKTTNRSSVVIENAVARDGKFPFELRGNRIVYDCTACESFNDVLDMDILHYGVRHSFALPVSYVKNLSGIGAVATDNAAADVAFELYDLCGRFIGKGTGDFDFSKIPDATAGGIYVLRTVNAAGAVCVRKVYVKNR